MTHRNTPGSTPEDDLGTTDPREVLAMLESQRADTRRQLDVNPRFLYLAWGAAWMVGYLAWYFSTPFGHSPLLPSWSGPLLFTGLLVAAGVVSAVHVSRRVSGIRGTSSAQGAMYGFSWFLGFAAMAAIGAALVRAGLSDEQTSLYFAGVSGLVVGLLYLAGGALWQDRTMYGVGAWLLLVFAVATFVGLPGSYLVLCVFGGGGFVAAGLVEGRSRATAKVS